MITGPGPGAPSVTPGMVFTPGHHGQSDPRHRAADLGAIRRSDAIIDLLATRRLLRPRALHDPAIALLSALATDIDSPAASAGSATGPGARGAPARGGAARPEATPARAAGPAPARASLRVRQQAGPRPDAGTWVRAAAAVAMAATAAGAAATTGVMVTGMLARLARQSARSPGGPVGTRRPAPAAGPGAAPHGRGSR